LIPETLRVTTFAELASGAMLNIEIDRQTRVLVDTLRDVIDERLETLQPLMRALLDQC
jgi:riboflavin synthase